MVLDLPLSIGVCIGRNKSRTVCVTGDGSIQWNIQELLFLQYHKLPLKIFIFNNQGYSSIRATQNAFFAGRFVGADNKSGVGNPEFKKLAAAYGIDYVSISNHGELDHGLRQVMSLDGAVICEVKIAVEQGITP